MKRTCVCGRGIAAPILIAGSILSITPSLFCQEVSPTQTSLGPEAAEVSPTSRATIAERLAATSIRPDFSGITIRDALDSISRIADIDFIVEWADSSFGEGLNPGNVIDLELRQKVAAGRLIDLVLDRAFSDNSPDETPTWNIEEGFVHVGPRRVLNGDRYVVVYPIHDLTMEIPEFRSASQMNFDAVLGGSDDGSISGPIFDTIETASDGRSAFDRTTLPPGERLAHDVTELVEPFQWERNGGTGGCIRYLKSTDSLLVSAPNYIHRQIGNERR